MTDVIISADNFRFTYLPDFASFILKEKLEEFVTVGIRYCREVSLPILKPLSRLTEEELVKLSLQSNQELLEAIATGNIAAYIERGSKRWADNSIGYLDREEVMVEDFTMGFHLRRKVFSYFLDAYTKNLVMQKFIIAELDQYTTQEELIAYKIFFNTQQEKFRVQNSFLLETQGLAEIGSFLINYVEPGKSIFTPEYKKILSIEGRVDYNNFINDVHADDRPSVNEAFENAKSGGTFEIGYRYNKNGTIKHIWSKGVGELKDGKIAVIKGSIRDITEWTDAMLQLEEAQSLYKLGQELNRTGNWSWDMGKGKLSWSDEMYQIFEVEDKKPMSLGEFLSLVHPADRERFKSQLEDMTLPARKAEYVFRIITPRGVEKLVKGVSMVQLTGHNLIARCYGTCQDITPG